MWWVWCLNSSADTLAAAKSSGVEHFTRQLWAAKLEQVDLNTFTRASTFNAVISSLPVKDFIISNVCSSKSVPSFSFLDMLVVRMAFSASSSLRETRSLAGESATEAPPEGVPAATMVSGEAGAPWAAGSAAAAAMSPWGCPGQANCAEPRCMPCPKGIGGGPGARIEARPLVTSPWGCRGQANGAVFWCMPCP